MTKILCLIPARSGSEGIKNKNIKKIKGMSLIEIACRLARKSEIFEDIIVSTDSKKYLNSVKKYVSNSNHLRPKKLSGINITDLQVITHEWKRYSKILNKDFDFICVLQPTCPLRKISHLKSAIKKIKRHNYDVLWTINSIDKKFNPVKQLLIKDKKLKYYDSSGKTFVSRQMLNQTFIRNGCAYFFSYKAIYKNKSVLPKNAGYLEINDKLINIDSTFDLQQARKLFKGVQ